MTRVLILGASGMLGHKVYQRLPGHIEVVGTTRQANSRLAAITRAGGRIVEGVDASHFESLERTLAETKPDFIVNCIGVIKQREDASDAVSCISQNSLLPHQLASWCKGNGTRLILVSTDCVFSGRTGCYTEKDVPDPVDLYGLSKLLGEVSGPGVLTFRTSMIGRELSTFRSLLEWFLRQRGEVRGYTRAIFSGLTTAAVADELSRVILSRADLSGIYHLAAAPISKYDLLHMIRSEFGIDIDIVPDDTVRCDRSLSGAHYAQQSGFVAPTWPAMIAQLKTDNRWYDEHP
jgi:dTDP-4-dehydrorhamnose reductase